MARRRRRSRAPQQRAEQQQAPPPPTASAPHEGGYTAPVSRDVSKGGRSDPSSQMDMYNRYWSAGPYSQGHASLPVSPNRTSANVEKSYNPDGSPATAIIRPSELTGHSGGIFRKPPNYATGEDKLKDDLTKEGFTIDDRAGVVTYLNPTTRVLNPEVYLGYNKGGMVAPPQRYKDGGLVPRRTGYASGGLVDIVEADDPSRVDIEETFRFLETDADKNKEQSYAEGGAVEEKDDNYSHMRRSENVEDRTGDYRLTNRGTKGVKGHARSVFRVTGLFPRSRAEGLRGFG